MNTQEDAEIRRLHALYGALVSPVALTMERMFAWEAWRAHILTALGNSGSTATPEQVLRVVIAWRRKMYADKSHIRASVLTFSHLVGKPALVEEDFAAWRAEKRARAGRPPAGLAEVERASGRAAETERRTAGQPAQTAAKVLDREAITKMLEACKEQIAAAPEVRGRNL
jgi:hypothetical protein